MVGEVLDKTSDKRCFAAFGWSLNNNQKGCLRVTFLSLLKVLSIVILLRLLKVWLGNGFFSSHI
jgi:hypothetical protein